MTSLSKNGVSMMGDDASLTRGDEADDVDVRD